ncbi:hypothetical protein BJ165DRAFT_907946 [Panaeolus papilionaceus]|nr:hypothetical protein BJ165DRAFT_907946 [Panaeolus papilionaceus]
MTMLLCAVRAGASYGSPNALYPSRLIRKHFRHFLIVPAPRTSAHHPFSSALLSLPFDYVPVIQSLIVPFITAVAYTCRSREKRFNIDPCCRINSPTWAIFLNTFIIYSSQPFYSVFLLERFHA